jgi:hypothetical protein
MDEHRWLMEQKIGRRLSRFEFVHHIDGDKRNNRLDNLEVVTPKEHATKHGQWKHPRSKPCLVCGKIFNPHATKRARAKTCGRECRYLLASLSQRKASGPRSLYREAAYPSEIARRKSRPSS